MENLHEFDGQIGSNERKEWTEEHFAKVQNFIKSHYDQLSPIEKLENRLYAIKTEMEHYLMEDSKEVRSIGSFVKEAVNAFKKILKIPQKRFEELWGISGNMGKYLKGERAISPELALKIACTLKITPKLLLDIQTKNELIKMDKYQGYKEKYSYDNLLRA